VRRGTPGVVGDVHLVEDALVVKRDLPEMGERCGDVVASPQRRRRGRRGRANRRAHGLPPCAFLLAEFEELPARFHAFDCPPGAVSAPPRFHPPVRRPVVTQPRTRMRGQARYQPRSAKSFIRFRFGLWLTRRPTTYGANSDSRSAAFNNRPTRSMNPTASA
jgi:hypothetical protein